MNQRGLSIDVEIVPMAGSDLERVLQIERASFSSPWSRSMFMAELGPDPISFSFVLRTQGRTVGYICFWIVFDELHLLNLAVDPEYRSKGLGEDAICWALNFGRRRGIHTACLEVRTSNHAALNLYKKTGFVPYGIRKDYYSDPQEDALLLSLEYNGGDDER